MPTSAVCSVVYLSCFDSSPSDKRAARRHVSNCTGAAALAFFAKSAPALLLSLSLSPSRCSSRRRRGVDGTRQSGQTNERPRPPRRLAAGSGPKKSSGGGDGVVIPRLPAAVAAQMECKNAMSSGAAAAAKAERERERERECARTASAMSVGWRRRGAPTAPPASARARSPVVLLISWNGRMETGDAAAVTVLPVVPARTTTTTTCVFLHWAAAAVARGDRVGFADRSDRRTDGPRERAGE